jgi:hypothetical protein
MVAAPFEAGHKHEEEKREEGEENKAPCPSSMMTEECEDIVAAGHKGEEETTHIDSR